MKKLSDDALAIANRFKDGPSYRLIIRDASKIAPRVKAALDELVEARVILVQQTVGGLGLDYQGTRRSTKVAYVIPFAKLEKLRKVLPIPEE